MTSDSGTPLSSVPALPGDANDEFNTQSLEREKEPETSTRKCRRTTVIAETTSALKTTSTMTTTTITKKPRRTKAQKSSDTSAMVPLAQRVATKTHFIGAHVSAAKGVQNSILNSVHIGANAFALFLKSQRKWASPPLDPKNVKLFKQMCHEHDYNPGKHMVPHGSYLVNLATPDPEKAKQAYACFLDDLKRCEELGIGLYNFHPGSTLGTPRDAAIARLAAHLNTAHAATTTVTLLLETMASPTSNHLGTSFSDLSSIISLIEDKSRIGVCLDTCHIFSAGYDIRTSVSYNEVMAEFDRVIGLKYLKALHINDSKAPFASGRDLHQNIGQGWIGLEAFRCIVNDERLHGVPMVLETPLESEGDTKTWAEEIKLLESMVGKGEEDIKEEAERLWALGEKERERVGAQVEKKREKERKAAEKKEGKVTVKRGRKKVEVEVVEESTVKVTATTLAKRGRKKAVKTEDTDSDASAPEPNPRSKRARKQVSMKEESTESESS
ncbi:AP endonuclease [Ascodesmis nigricans]|uniref:Apurinic-apyrimidinic endonuclease 1 n=1 Tax=Ascodesmis nigricans TaxID=341454 RepID=A0A4S2MT37_9PEZI|nr:AP endonuclease [Ascodesmis nigricans]